MSDEGLFESDEDSKPQLRCQVCDLPASPTEGKRTGAVLVCQACKKFFLRNRYKDTTKLRCISGTDDCVIGQSTATAIGSGVLWRMACPRCRLAKCLAIGLGKSRRPSLADDYAHEVVGVEETPHSECSLIENALQEIISATNKLTVSFNTSPLVSTVRIFVNEIDAWSGMMEQTQNFGKDMTPFANSVPGYNKLSTSEQTFILEQAKPALTLAVSNRSGPNPCGVSLFNALQMMAFFPEFEFAQPYAQALSTLFSAWNPSAIEYPCLLAILLHQGCSAAEMEPNNGLPALTQDLGLLVHASLMQLCCGNVEVFNLRLQHLLYVAKAIQTAASYRGAALMEAVRRRPYLLLLKNPLLNLKQSVAAE